MKYSEVNTKALQGCQACLDSLSSLLKREGSKLGAQHTQKGEIQGVDFEAFADKIQKGGDKKPRVDIIYALENNAIQLVECKLRVDKPARLNNYQEELISKRNSSRNLCTSSFIDHSTIESTLFVIVNPSIEQATRSAAARRFPIKKKTSILRVMSIESLLNEHF